MLMWATVCGTTLGRHLGSGGVAPVRVPAALPCGGEAPSGGGASSPSPPMPPIAGDALSTKVPGAAGPGSSSSSSSNLGPAG